MANLPNVVYNTLEDVCDEYNSKYPKGIPEEHLFSEALNKIAWKHRDLGFGLSEKTGGQNVPFLDTHVAEDVLQLPNGQHWDVFGSAKVGNYLNPAEIDHGIIKDKNRKWIAPVNPSTLGNGNPVPEQPEPEKPKPPTNPLPPDGDLVDAGVQLETYYRTRLNRAERETPVDVLGYARWIGFDYIFSRQQGMNHEQALEAMFKNIIAITGIPK